MPSTLRSFSRFGKYLATIDAPATPRSWVLNSYGKCEFTVGLTYLSDKFSPKEETILQYNNLAYIEHIPSQDAAGNKNGKLPAWVGVILPDRTWDFGMVHATAYSAEAILTFRPLPLEPIKNTPANIFKQILDYARIDDGVVIQPGIVEDIPETFSDVFTTSAYDHIQKLVNRAGMNWDVTAQIDARGSLQLYANLYRRKGADTNLILNNDNTELSGQLLTEQGTPYNTIYGYSSSSTKEDRYFSKGINQASVDKIGPMARNHIFSGTTDQAGLQNAAQTMADASPPLKKIHRVALDIGSTFDSLQTGNTVKVKDTNVGFKPGGGYGFEAQAFILSVDYNDLSNKCPLNLEII